MKPSEIDTLSEDEVLTMALLFGGEFTDEYRGGWTMALEVWHPMEREYVSHAKPVDGWNPNIRAFDSKISVARAYVKWALTSRVTA